MTDRLHVGMIVPPYYEVPPRGYGGIEATVATLVDALIDLGHRVTLVSAGRSGTRADHVRTYAEPQYERLGHVLPEVAHVAAADRALREAGVDVVHDHTLTGLLLARGRSTPTLATVHGDVKGEVDGFYSDIGTDVSLIAISDAQRSGAPHLNWRGTVHNAIDPASFRFREDKDDFVLFLGRMTPDKGVVLAMEAARAAGRKLVIATKCSEPHEQAYFESEVRPRLVDGEVEYVGEAEGERKLELLAAASALLFPICWEEPFGMVMIEAMASGTPVVALARGAVPEVVDDGVTGYVCRYRGELPAALHKARQLDPGACRLRVEEHFSPKVMARGYERAYREACRDQESRRRAERRGVDRQRPAAVATQVRLPGRLGVVPTRLADAALRGLGNPGRR